MNSNQPTPITTILEETPQLQTVMQDGLAPVTSIVNAPWVNVTSVNGKTGDVAIVAQVADYMQGVSYERGDIVIYQSNLYWATSDFISGPFNPSQWKSFSDSAQVQSNWNETNQDSPAYILNKPTKLSQFTNDPKFTTDAQVNAKISTSANNILDTVDEKIDIVNDNLATKVDKVDGQGLSSNNYTNEDKTKLTNLASITSIGQGLNLDQGILSGSSSNLIDKIYNVTTVSNTGYTLSDPELTPVVGTHIYIKIATVLGSAYSKLSVNGGAYENIQNAIFGATSALANVVLSANTIYELIYLGSSWQCLNATAQLTSGSLARNSVGGAQINWTNLKNQYLMWDNDIRANCSAWTWAQMASTTVSGLESYADYYYIACIRWVEAPGDAEVAVDFDTVDTHIGAYTTTNGLRSVTVVGKFRTTSTTATMKKWYNGTAGSVRFGPVSILLLRASY